jgi:hypothetical protein
MKENKIKIDRPIISSEEINSKQDFTKVVEGFRKIKPPLWKNPWFYGPIGLASLAIVLTLTTLNNNEFEEKTTLIESKDIKLPADTECIHKPIKNLENNSEVFYVKTDKSESIQLASGTELTFPKGSLIVSGKDSVRIEVKEFNDKSSAFVSGILMDHGDDSAFESAGMIEISGTVKGEPCTINPSIPVEVNFVLNQNPENFPFWKLDTLENKWVDYPVKYKVAQSNYKSHTKHNNEKLNLEEQKKLLQNNLKENNIAFQAVVVPSKVDYKLPLDGKQKFDLDFDLTDFPELKSFKGMNFEVYTQEAYDKSFTKKTWSDVSLKKEQDVYFAYFKNKQETFKIQVRPVLSGNDKVKSEKEFQKALNESEEMKKELFEKNKEIRKELEETENKYKQLVASFKDQTDKDLELAKESSNGRTMVTANEFVANFSIVSFGIYNCDKVNKYPKTFARDFVFSYNGSSAVNIKNAYVFDQNLNTRYSYGNDYRHVLQNLGFNKGNENVLITIDESGHLGYVLKFDEFSFEKEKLKLTRVDKKDINLAFIQKLLSESTVEI